MSLIRIPFTSQDIAAVQTFDCGEAPYEKEVSDWLKGDANSDSALNSIQSVEKPAQVWLFKLHDGTVVGYGALAKTEWRWKGKKDPFIPVTILIWLGLHKEFQGARDPVTGKKYAFLIVSNLVAEAELHKKTHPVLGLLVHRDNQRAIDFYTNLGFTSDLEPRLNKVTKQVEYLRMAVVLDDEMLKQLRPALKKNS